MTDLTPDTMTAPEQHPAADQLIAAVHEAISEQGYPRLHDEDAAAVATAVLQWAVYNCEDLWPQADPLTWISRLADAIEAAR